MDSAAGGSVGGGDVGDECGSHEDFREIEVREQDRFLPIANIARIMKKTLPNNAKIAKDAKESIQECVSEFISFITSEASDKCQQEKRKTINGDDILWAMSTLGFDRYVEPLKMYLAKYRGSVRGDRPELGGGGGGKKLAGGGSGSGVSLSMPGGGAGSLLGGVKKELSAQPKLDSLVGGPTDAPIFAYEATSGVMSMLPDYAPPSLAPGKNEPTPLLPPPPPMRVQSIDALASASSGVVGLMVPPPPLQAHNMVQAPPGPAPLSGPPPLQPTTLPAPPTVASLPPMQGLPSLQLS